MTTATIVLILMLKMSWAWIPITAALIGLAEIEKQPTRKVSRFK